MSGRSEETNSVSRLGQKPAFKRTGCYSRSKTTLPSVTCSEKTQEANSHFNLSMSIKIQFSVH